MRAWRAAAAFKGPIYVPAAGPEKGSKEWKEAEKKRKKKEKEDEKKADKEQKAAQKRIKQAKKISKQAEKNGVAPPTLPDTPDGTISPGGTDYGEKFDSPQWGQTAPVDPFAAPSPSLPALPSLHSLASSAWVTASLRARRPHQPARHSLLLHGGIASK